jgi:hypothetical protein
MSRLRDVMVEPADAQLELPFDEFVRELDPSLPRDRIWESAHECAEANLTIASGALTDSILAENKAADERELQVLAAHAGQVHTGAVNRREWLMLALTAASTVFAGGALYTAYDSAQRAVDRQREFDQWKLNPNLVIEIVRKHHKRTALRKLLADIKGSNPNEAFLIEAIFDHGSSFDRAHQNLRRLKNHLENGSTDPDVVAFLARKYASDHRYLGLSKQARDIIMAVALDHASDRILRFMMLEMRYGTMLPLFIAEPGRIAEGGADYGGALRTDCQSILASMSQARGAQSTKNSLARYHPKRLSRLGFITGGSFSGQRRKRTPKPDLKECLRLRRRL